MQGDYAKAQYTAGMYAEMFGRENYLIELQDHGLKEQTEIMEPLLRIAKELKLTTIASNGRHQSHTHSCNATRR